MENQKMPEYETIRAAVAGEKWAVEKVVECYKDEIDRLSTVAVRQPDGSTKQEINEDMRQSIPCLVKLRIEQPVGGKHRNPEPLAEKRIGNELRTYAFVSVVQ